METPDDEMRFEREDRQDLLARLRGAQALAQFILIHALDAMRDHSVDFRSLPEWLDQSPLDAALKLRSQPAQEAIVAYFARLESALHAAVRRKSMRLVR